jgi:hypothetical protein
MAGGGGKKGGGNILGGALRMVARYLQMRLTLPYEGTLGASCSVAADINQLFNEVV